MWIRFTTWRGNQVDDTVTSRMCSCPDGITESYTQTSGEVVMWVVQCSSCDASAVISVGKSCNTLLPEGSS